MYRLAILASIILFASADSHQKYADTHQVLAEIDQDAFGNIVLSAIQSHIQAKAPQDEVVLLLNQILSSITDDQEQQDQLNSVNQAACSRITGDLENNIAYQNAQISSNTVLRDDSTAALEEAETDIRQTIQDVTDNEDTYEREQATRDEQNALFQTRDGEVSSATDAIDEAAKLIQHLQLGASFAQVKTRIDSVQKHLKEQTSHQSLFRPIITALTELAATEVDPKAIATIAQLIAEIRQQLVASRLQLNDTEDRQAAHWVEFSLHLTQEHARLAERKQQLEGAISLNKGSIETADQQIEYYTVEVENAQDSLSTQQKWCSNQSERYETSSIQRNNQIDLITRIQEHVIDHLSASAQFLADRNSD